MAANTRDIAVGDPDHLICRRGLAFTVRDQNDRRAVADRFPEIGDDTCLTYGIERRGAFIHDQTGHFHAHQTGQFGKVDVVPAAAPAATSKGHGHGAAATAPSKTAGLVMAAIGIVAAIAWLVLRFGYKNATVGADTGLLLQHLTVFVLAVFVGWQVVWNVTPALHTPLMSVTNAISGVIVVGGILGAGSGHLDASAWVAIAATLFATINIAGGFLVTRRMLAMFRK